VDTETLLRQKLRDARIRPADLARALDVTPAMGSLILSGERGIAVWHLDAIATLLHTSIPDLFVPRQTQIKALDTTAGVVSSTPPIHQSSKVVSTEDTSAHRPAGGGSPPTGNPLWAAMRLRELTDDLSDLARYFVSVHAGSADTRSVQKAPARAGGAHRVHRSTPRGKRGSS
jgi:hypothetical protein